MSARVDDGWVPISEPPPSIPERRASRLGRVVIWFQNADLSQIRACDRIAGDYDCYHEIYATYELRGDEWVELVDGSLESEIFCVH